MEKQFSMLDPVLYSFFDIVTVDGAEEASPSLTIHKWVLANVEDSDSASTVRSIANSAVKEIIAASVELASELALQELRLLPRQPVWSDGAPLFIPTGTTVNHPSTGVREGNLLKSTGCFATDVELAARRLTHLLPGYNKQEELQLFCAKPLVKKLVKASHKAGVSCRVHGLFNHRDSRSWSLMRVESACSLEIKRPEFTLPCAGASKIVVGAALVLRVVDPRLIVHVTAVQ